MNKKERERKQGAKRQRSIRARRTENGLKEMRCIIIPEIYEDEIKEKTRALVKRVIRKYEGP